MSFRKKVRILAFYTDVCTAPKEGIFVRKYLDYRDEDFVYKSLQVFALLSEKKYFKNASFNIPTVCGPQNPHTKI